jgi:hypothetical protein
MTTNYDYKILKRTSKDAGRVAVDKVPAPRPKYATVEYVDKKFNELRSEVKQDVNEVKQEIININTRIDSIDVKLDLLLKKK